jgi:syntenin-1
VILCKDADNKVGLRVKAINKGIFVCLVTRGSPAAMGGLRFGDQASFILVIFRQV